jgi:phage terminase large subunit-like protein
VATYWSVIVLQNTLEAAVRADDEFAGERTSKKKKKKSRARNWDVVIRHESTWTTRDIMMHAVFFFVNNVRDRDRDLRDGWELVTGLH